VGFPVAGLAALTTVFAISIFPPSIHRKQMAFAVASSEFYLNAPTGPNVAPALTYFFSLQQWAETLAEEMTSPELKGLIAGAARIPTSQLAIDGPISNDLQRTQQEPTGEKRSSQLLTEGDPYRIELNDDSDLAGVGISAEAPTPAAAANLARAAEVATDRYLARTQAAADTPPKARLEIDHLAPIVPTGGSHGHTVAALVFLIVLTLWTGLVVLLAKLSRELAAIRDAQESGAAQISLSPARSSTSRYF
jgi:hypothetical protein